MFTHVDCENFLHKFHDDLKGVFQIMIYEGEIEKKIHKGEIEKFFPEFHLMI